MRCRYCNGQFPRLMRGMFCCNLCQSQFFASVNHGVSSADSVPEHNAYHLLVFLSEFYSDHEKDEFMYSFRGICRIFKQAAQLFARELIPISTRRRFVTAYGNDFENFGKNGNIDLVPRLVSMGHGFNIYTNVVVNIKEAARDGPAFLELFPEKKIIFKDRTAAEWRNGRLFHPINKVWTPQINDSWILANIHTQQDFRLLAQLSHIDNFWDPEFPRPTVLGRELIQIWRSGYRPILVDEAAEPYRGFGILMRKVFTSFEPDSLTHAKNVTRAEIIHILTEMQRVYMGPVKMPPNSTGKRTVNSRLDPDTGEPISQPT